MIEIYPGKRRLIRDSMNEMGFYEEGRHFRHPDSEFIIEFPQGPLSIGDEKVTQFVEIGFSTGTLKLYRQRIVSRTGWRRITIGEINNA
jgi:hypothetical protein